MPNQILEIKLPKLKHKDKIMTARQRISKTTKILKPLKFHDKNAIKILNSIFLAFGMCLSALQASALKCQLKATQYPQSYKISQKEQQALSLITQSIQQPNSTEIIKKLATLDSTLGKLYILQLHSLLNQINSIQATDDSEVKCQACVDFAKSALSFAFGSEKNQNHIKELLELDSSARVGEELLCVGLASKDTKALIESYAHFALAGVNTRAINALLSAVKMGDKDAARILEFLLDNGVYLSQNTQASQTLKKAISSGNLNSIFTNSSKDFVVREFNAYSNVLENLFYQSLLSRGVIIDELDTRYASLSIASKADSASILAKELDKAKSLKQAVIAKMSTNEKNEFNEALKFKQHLHNVDETPYTSTYLIKQNKK